MTADTAHADAFADGQREAGEADRVALVIALDLPTLLNPMPTPDDLAWLRVETT